MTVLEITRDWTVLVAFVCGCGGAQAQQEPAEVVHVANVPPVQSGTYAPEPPPVEVGLRYSPPPEAGPVRQDGNKLKLPDRVMFEVGKAVIKRESEPALTALRDFLAEKRQLTLLRIEGHSDSTGMSAMNLQLSGSRALAIREWLVRQGIDPGRLIAVGFGDVKPIADNATEEGRALNRRIEYVVVEVNGKPWLGADPVGGGALFGPNPRP